MTLASVNLARPTYVCLDLPDPQASAIMALRRRFCQRLRDFPPEVTIAGSSGIGAIRRELYWDRVEPKLLKFARESPPVRASFGGIVRFPDTDIFCLSMGDPMPLFAVHERLRHAGIAFEPSQFPFFPHCTIRMAGPLSEGDVSALFSISIPGEFVLGSLSLYQRMDDDRIVKAWSAALTGLEPPAAEA